MLGHSTSDQPVVGIVYLRRFWKNYWTGGYTPWEKVPNFSALYIIVDEKKVFWQGVDAIEQSRQSRVNFFKVSGLISQPILVRNPSDFLCMISVMQKIRKCSQSCYKQLTFGVINFWKWPFMLRFRTFSHFQDVVFGISQAVVELKFCGISLHLIFY